MTGCSQARGDGRTWDAIGEAIVVWTGWRSFPYPRRNLGEGRLVERFGSQLAADVLPLIKSLEDDFYWSNARFVAKDLVDMGEIASAQFRERHPEIPEVAVQALAWCYTYDYK
jgi:hypothetical protein